MINKNVKNNYIWELVRAINCLENNGFDDAVVNIMKERLVDETIINADERELW